MSRQIKNILIEISKTHGIKAFKNKNICYALLSDYLGTKLENEAKLLIRLAKHGYISDIVKLNKSKELIQVLLYEDEFIDREISVQLVDNLFEVIEKAKEQEAAVLAELKQKEIELREQKMPEILSDSLKNILKASGLDFLNDYNKCRALLKDMANGSFTDEITIISILLKNNIQNDKQIKRKIFRKSVEDLATVFIDSNFASIDTKKYVDIDLKQLIQIIIKCILEFKVDNKNEGGLKKWIESSLKSLKK